MDKNIKLRALGIQMNFDDSVNPIKQLANFYKKASACQNYRNHIKWLGMESSQS